MQTKIKELKAHYYLFIYGGRGRGGKQLWINMMD
jgi:hypothetical protein